MSTTASLSTVVDDKDVYVTLDNLFQNADTNVSNIQTTIQTINTARNSYDEFTTNMENFTRYENMIDARLQQLKAFVQDNTAINTETEALTNLESRIQQVAERYAGRVSANNTLADQVNTKFEEVKTILTNLSQRSASLSQKVDNYTNLISTKRAVGYAAAKTIMLAVTPQAYAADSFLTFDATGFSIIQSGFFNLGFSFTLNGSRQGIFYGGYAGFPTTGQAYRLTVNIEVLTTTSKIIDTTTKFTVIQQYRDSSTGMSKENLFEVSALSSVSFNVRPNDGIFVKPKTAIVASNSIWTFSLTDVLPT
jgi:hypothetical protein